MTKPHALVDQPIVFISYAWTSESHKTWVRQLADDLVANNVDVIFDGYSLKPGQDTYSYMEQMVSKAEIRKVLCICDQVYQEKADVRKGGVGTETQIISPELYAKSDQTKYVPIIRGVDEQGRPCVPVFLKGKYFIDFTDDDKYYDKLEELLRDIYNKPKSPKPPFGAPPSFLAEDGMTLATAGLARRIEIVLREGSPASRGLIDKYTDAFMAAMPDFRLSSEAAQATDMDDRIVDSIHKLQVYRDDFLEVVDAVALYGKDERLVESLHRFLEGMLNWTEPPMGEAYNQLWYDNHRFIRRDIFVCTIAILVKRGCWPAARRLLDEGYYTASRGQSDIVTFGAFEEGMEALDRIRNARLKLNRVSVTADLIRELTPTKHFDFEYYMQVDLLLWVRSVLDLVNEDFSTRWYPRTAPFFERGARFELFQRARTSQGLANLMTFMGVASKQVFLERFQSGGEHVRRWADGWVNFVVRTAEKWPDSA